MPDPVAFAAVVVAAGSSSRFAAGKKEYRLLEGRPVLAHSLSTFLDMPGCLATVAVVPPGGLTPAADVLGQAFLHRYASRLLLAEGGAERSDSVLAGLRALETIAPPLVLVHDGARPWASRALAERVLGALAAEYAGSASPDTARGNLAVAPGIALTDTVKVVDPAGMVVQHPARSSLRAVQTPQGFPYRALLAVASTDAGSVTDDAEAWARAGGRVLIVDGERCNQKITFPEDLA